MGTSENTNGGVSSSNKPHLSTAAGRSAEQKEKATRHNLSKATLHKTKKHSLSSQQMSGKGDSACPDNKKRALRDLPAVSSPEKQTPSSLKRASPPGSASESPPPPEKPSKSTGALYFANDALSKQQVIDELSHNKPPGEVICIRTPDDLEGHGLIEQTWLEKGQLHKEEGRIFRDDPLTLIFDLTTMAPGDIASLNDILQVNPSCNGKPLGDQVKRVVLVNEAMLQGDQPSNPDLWRRLRLMTQEEIPNSGQTSATITDDALLAKVTLDVTPADKNTVVIDFAANENWHRQLFGGITSNERVQLIFTEGALANLPDNPHVIFKNAPWDESGFKEALAMALRTHTFNANRQWITLPDNLTLSKESVSQKTISEMKQKAVQKNNGFDPGQRCVCLNSHSLESLKSQFRVDGTTVVRENLLAALLHGSEQLVITSPLDEKQWLWLLTQLNALPENQRPRLLTEVSPAALTSSGLSNRDTKKNRDQKPQDAFHYQFHANDSVDCLQQVNLTSRNTFTFSLSNTHLMKSLIDGRPVVLSGLEKNPKLAGCLETLLLPNPYLFINGHKVALPRADVTLVRPECDTPTASALINQVFSQQERLHQPDQNPIYALLQKLPHSLQKNRPATPPWTPMTFQQHFDNQVNAEKEQDNSARIKPCHKRRALHVLLAKPYRGDPRVYSYIKAKIAKEYPDEGGHTKADKSALKQWLAKHPDPSKAQLKRDFWQLARHCPPTVHQQTETLEEIDDESVKRLATYVAGAADTSSRQWSLARQFRVNLKKAQQCQFVSDTLRSNVRDALVATQTKLKPGLVISPAQTVLEDRMSDVLQSSLNDVPKKQHIEELLRRHYCTRDSLPKECQGLPAALLADQRHTATQQRRRLEHLARRIQKHPVVFLQGEAGAGKSFMAQAVAAKAGYADTRVISLGPNRTSEELFGGQQLVTVERNGQIDHITEFRQGPLLEWALSDDPPLLILDEANLAPEGLLAPLAGLTRQPPVICYQGREYRLSDKHRIILTGNPDHYDGRHLDETLRSCIPTFFYHPLSKAVLAESIILPGLPNLWPDQQKQQACDRLLTLFSKFRELVPDDLTTPRDILDVLATVRQILSHRPAQAELSEQQINALIHRAFMDSLAGAVPAAQQQRLTALNLWYQSQFPKDDGVSADVDTAFTAFFEQLKAQNPKTDFTPEPVRQLVYRYWQSLDKDDRGRTATLVEGPAGWGKDYILGKTVRLWQQLQNQAQRPSQTFAHFNANPNHWSTLVNKVKDAMTKGHLIAISELNLIPSRYLEGLFNDVLTGYSAPGFRLFATINPGTFAGREPLSPALKSRCTQVRLGALSRQDLEGLVRRIPYIRENLPEWLAAYFHQLSEALTSQQSPVQLTLDDLFSTAKALQGGLPSQWPKLFEQHLSLPFRALKKPLPPLNVYEERLAHQQQQEQQRARLNRIANSQEGLEHPITVRYGNTLCVSDREITVPDHTTDQEIIRLVQSRQKRTRDSAARDSAARDSAASTAHENSAPPQSGSPYDFGDILQLNNYRITRYFPEYPYDRIHYRQEFLETRLDNEGQLRDYTIGWQDGGIAPVAGWPDDMPWRTQLREDELPGYVKLTLNSQWQPLPALTPADQLRAIRVTPDVNIQLARSEVTGQLLIQTGSNTPVTAKIDFIIAPDQTYFKDIKSTGHSVIIQDTLCSLRLQNLLDDKLCCFQNDISSDFKQLLGINTIDNIPDRLNGLRTWLDTFSDKKNITGQGEELLLNMLKEKQGICEQKSMLFQILCHYWGIPARQVGNAVSHRFVEISPDGGKTWRQYQLGGGGENHSTITEPNWSAYQQSKNSVLRPPPRRSGGSGDGQDRGESNSYPAIRNIRDNKAVSTAEMKHLKNYFLKLIEKNYAHRYFEFEDIYTTILTNNFYTYIKEDNEWPALIENLIKVCPLTEHNCHSIMYWHKLSFPAEESYIGWLCELCETSHSVKKFILGTLHQQAITSDNHPHKDRIFNLVKQSSLPTAAATEKHTKDIEIECIETAKKLPKSQQFINQISHPRINKKFESAPKENSTLVPDRLAAGLPAFLIQSTKKEAKPVIIDYSRIKKVAYNKFRNIEINNLTNINGDSLVSSTQSLNIPRGVRAKTTNTTILEHLFIAWICQHKSDDSNDLNSEWIWFQDDTVYHVQQQPSPLPPLINYMDDDSYRTSHITPHHSPEKIRRHFKKPSAVVLQEKELSKLMDEFIQLL